MIGLVKTDARENVTLRDRVYGDLRHALMTGRFLPGQKMPIRALAATLGTSLTPVREALGRLITEGVLEGRSNRSVRVPLMTRTKLRELRELRVTLESIGAARAAEIITRDEVANLRVLALEIMAARTRGDHATDMLKIREFHFAVCAAARMPVLFRIVESLWLQTGPYMNRLFPDYVRSRANWRARLCAALEGRDVETARQEMAKDVGDALHFIADLADSEGVIHPRPLPPAGAGRAPRVSRRKVADRIDSSSGRQPARLVLTPARPGARLSAASAGKASGRAAHSTRTPNH